MANYAAHYYKTSPDNINWQMTQFMIVQLIVTPFIMWAVDHWSFRWVVRTVTFSVTVFLCFAAAIISHLRCVLNLTHLQTCSAHVRPTAEFIIWLELCVTVIEMFCPSPCANMYYTMGYTILC